MPKMRDLRKRVSMRNRQTLSLQVVHTFTSTGQVALACEDQLEAGHWLWAKITALRGERSRTSLVRTVAAAGGSQPGTTLWRAGKALDWKTQAGFEDGDLRSGSRELSPRSSRSATARASASGSGSRTATTGGTMGGRQPLGRKDR